MNFSCRTAHLSSAVNTVQKAVPTNTTLPALTGVMISAVNDKLKLICNNLEICVECTVPAKISQNGVILVNSRIFFEIVRKIKDDEITVALSGNNVQINTATSSFEILSMSTDDFPLPEQFSQSPLIFLEENKLRDIIKSTIFSAGVNSEKMILTGCLFEFKKSSVRMVAVDGYRLAIRTEELPENMFEGNFVVPAKALSELLKILTDSEENLYISFSDKNILFEFQNVKFYTKILDGEFIDYEKIIPNDFTTKIHTDKSEMENALEQVSIMVNNDKFKSPLEIKISGDSVEFCCSSVAGSAKRLIKPQISGEELRIGFNNKFLLDAVKNCHEEDFCVSFGSPVSPCLFHRDDSDNFKFLILPVRLKDEF